MKVAFISPLLLIMSLVSGTTSNAMQLFQGCHYTIFGEPKNVDLFLASKEPFIERALDLLDVTKNITLQELMKASLVSPKDRNAYVSFGCAPFFSFEASDTKVGFKSLGIHFGYSCSREIDGSLPKIELDFEPLPVNHWWVKNNYLYIPTTYEFKTHHYRTMFHDPDCHQVKVYSGYRFLLKRPDTEHQLKNKYYQKTLGDFAKSGLMIGSLAGLYYWYKHS